MARHVKKEEASASRKQEARDRWVGLLCLQGRWRYASTSLSLWNSRLRGHGGDAL